MDYGNECNERAVYNISTMELLDKYGSMIEPFSGTSYLQQWHACTSDSNKRYAVRKKLLAVHLIIQQAENQVELRKRVFIDHFTQACTELLWLAEHWQEEYIRNYPSYLPSFDEFIADFSCMMDEDEG